MPELPVIKIVDNVPVPPKGHRKKIYPFDTMEIGQCAEIKGPSRAAVYASAKKSSGRSGNEYHVTEDKSKNVVLVWRTA